MSYVKLADLKIGSLYEMIPSGITFFEEFYAVIAHYNYHGFDFCLQKGGIAIPGEFDHSPKIYYLPDGHETDSEYSPITFLLLDRKQIYHSLPIQAKKQEQYYALQILSNERIVWFLISSNETYKLKNMQIKEVNEH